MGSGWLGLGPTSPRGNSAELPRWWYWAGAILGGYPLATGSVYLLFKNRRIAHALTGASLAEY